MSNWKMESKVIPQSTMKPQAPRNRVTKHVQGTQMKESWPVLNTEINGVWGKPCMVIGKLPIVKMPVLHEL